MCDGKNPKLFSGDLINNAVWKPTKSMSPTSAAKHSSEPRIVQNEIGRSLKLSHKRKAKLDIRL